MSRWGHSSLADFVDKLAKSLITFFVALKIKNLQLLEIFVAAADHGGLSAAARQLALSPAVASAALKRLESELQVALFVRTTRSMRLTLEGERFLARCRLLLEGLREAEEEVQAGLTEIHGQLQLSMPSDLGRNLILPWLDEFQQRYPRVRLRLQLSDRLADMVRDPVDVALRFGTPPDSGMIALPLLTENRRVLCAAPAYLAARGAPETPAGLAARNCLCFMLDDTLYHRWRFSRGNERIEVAVSGDRVAGDSDVVRRWALAGHGIAYRSRLDVEDDIAAGRLRVLCPDWEGENVPLYLLCADRRQLSPAVRLLREFLLERFAGRPRLSGAASAADRSVPA